MHGNVSEWVWDYYGKYGSNEVDPTGAATGILRVYGGGRFGQSLTAIAKLAPDSTLEEGLSIHYSGGSSLGDVVAVWIRINNIQTV